MSPARKSSELLLPRGTQRPRRVTVETNPAIQTIWDIVSLIPRGKVATYGAIARASGLPGRARLAGFALKIAPKEMSLPWHRVVGAGGRIVFPRTSLQHREQARRLRTERIVIKNGCVHPEYITDMDVL